MYDLIIIGAGPAGVAAGVYARRKKIKTLLITKSFGGQSVVSNNIENWIGKKSISGFELAKSLEEHLKSQEGVDILEEMSVVKVSKINNRFLVETDQGRKFETKTVLIASGSRHRKLNIPGEDKFEGKGVVYCSTCDAPLFKNKTVAVIGGGNSAFEAVIDLFPYAQKIYLLIRSDKARADLTYVDLVEKNSKTEIIFNAEAREISGNDFVRGLKYEDKLSGQTKELVLEGVFIEIGSDPNSDIAKDLVKTDERGAIMVDHKTQRTSVEGIWAAGDVVDGLYKQSNISAGDAIKALLNINDYLTKNHR